MPLSRFRMHSHSHYSEIYNKLLGTSATLVVTSALLVVTKKLLETSATLVVQISEIVKPSTRALHRCGRFHQSGLSHAGKHMQICRGKLCKASLPPLGRQI